MKYGITKQYEAAAGETGGAAPAITTEGLLKELNTIKAALEKNLNDKAAEKQKNLDEKLESIKAGIEEAEKLKSDATAEELEKIKADALLTQKALDVLQTRMKAQQQSRGNGGQGQFEDMSLKGQIKSALEGSKADIVTGKIVGKSKEDQMTVKAVQDMTLGTNLTGNFPATYRNAIVPVPYENIHMRDLVAVTPSATDSYHFYRHSVGEGVINFQGGENNTKPQIDEDLAEVTVNLDYLAGWLKISRKMLRNFPALQAYISRWLPERYYQTEDTKAYQSLISQATGVQDVSGTDTISQIIRTIGLQKKARYNVNGIVVDGVTWARILTYKATGSGEFTMPIGVVTISPTGQLLIVGIPVYTASWVGGDEAIIGDWRYFEIIQSESLSLGFFEQDDKNVQQNKITVRIEASVGFAMLDPKAFVVASLESVS